jgi:UDP-glucose 4-epimerase
MRILVTGGTGYIGSHTVVALQEHGHDVVILDNLSNSDESVVKRIEAIAGTRPQFVQGDVNDLKLVTDTLRKHKIEAVIHFAALKAVGESVEQPLDYYHNNVGGAVQLARAMQQTGVKTIIFSSSACVYGDQPIPYTEATPRAPANPYGRTKHMVELVLEDWAAANPKLTAVTLRYFNPIGAHPSGQIGENPSGVPNNLMPYIAQVANGEREHLRVWGNDYDTPDGTARRDYIHVSDLAEGHVAALEKLSRPGFYAYNLGTGKSTSVLQMVQAFEKATGVHIPYVIAPRRAGDLPDFYADTSKAEHDLSWRAKRSIEEACADTWRWQQHLGVVK